VELRIGVAQRVLWDQLFGRNLREHYWAADQMRRRIVLARRPENAAFYAAMGRDFGIFLLGRIVPIKGETRERARAAVDWILRAQQASGDDGVSLGYFPCDGEKSWRPSYPETTGYIITSLLEFGQHYDDEAVCSKALRMAHWETDIQMQSGAVQGGPVCTPEKQTPTAFNT
jgi:hypothetical protein